MEERRRLDRKLLNYFSRVIDKENDRLLGYLVDLTTDGALMVGEAPLQTGSIVRLRIDLPESFPDEQELEFRAKAVWSGPDPDAGLYRTGLQLIETEPDDLVILERLIAEYGM